jgi:peroxiredoxin
MVVSGMKVVRRSASIVALIAGLAINAFAQQNKAADAVEELLKSVGLSRPAMPVAPDFNLLDSQGRPVALSDYRGKLVLLNFWATWCGPCREEMPSMERLHRKFGEQGLAVLAVNQRENAAQVNKFMKTQGLNFTTLLDTTGRVAGYYRVYGIPVSYLVDRHGQAIGIRSGSMDWAAPAVFSTVQKLIGDGGASAGGGSLALEPTKRLPSTLRARVDGVAVRVQQDAAAEVVGKLERGDEITPLGKVFGAGEFWYMVKTKRGMTGWVRGGEVEDASVPR